MPFGGSSQGDGGTLFVAAATPPSAPSSGTNARSGAVSAWATNAPAYVPQISVAVEDYNRLIRMIQAGEKLTLSAELQVQFHTNDLLAYNTVAEIPGTTRADEIVMLGAHLDSWHAGTGATDNGTGKIRGIYLQGNEAARPIFRQWLTPFRDLGAETITLGNTGGTDHQSFDAVGLPGFQFIQNPIEYWTRTHHSNADVFDRIQADDLKQAATLIAAFAWNAAMADEKLPRKPATEERRRR